MRGVFERSYFQGFFHIAFSPGARVSCHMVVGQWRQGGGFAVLGVVVFVAPGHPNVGFSNVAHCWNWIWKWYGVKCVGWSDVVICRYSRM